MGFQMFLVVMFLIGIGAEASVEDCLETLNLEEDLDSMTDFASEENLDLVCEKLSSFVSCVNSGLRDELDLDLTDLADVFDGTDIGNVLRVFVNIQELIGDICTEGTELRNGLLENMQCYDDIPDSIVENCEEQVKDIHSTFGEIQEEFGEAGSSETSGAELCVSAAHAFGCLGAGIKEECGEQGFEFYKAFVKKIGFFKSGLCSSEIMNTIKTDFLDTLEITEDQKNLYRVILNLKRRRR